MAFWGPCEVMAFGTGLWAQHDFKLTGSITSSLVTTANNVNTSPSKWGLCSSQYRDVGFFLP